VVVTFDSVEQSDAIICSVTVGNAYIPDPDGIIIVCRENRIPTIEYEARIKYVCKQNRYFVVEQEN
jgi:hypothetical protein